MYTIEEVVDWLSCHEVAWEDALTYFEIEVEDEDFDDGVDTMCETVSVEELVDWIYDHETLAEDFERYFGIGEDD